MKRTIARYVIAPAAAAAAIGAIAFAGSAEADQPYMHDALGQLQAARATLVAATPDKGGHRLRAIADVNAAIAEVRAGVNFDRRH